MSMSSTFVWRLKQLLWKLFSPFFPTVRDIWVALGFIKHNKRQSFHLGWLKPDVSARDLRQLLAGAGFSNDYIAWIDPDEVVNMRLVVDNIYQYHVRLFNDNEICGHHEFAAEIYPFKHLYEIGMTSGANFLQPLLASVMTEAKPLPLATPDPK